MSCHSLCYVSNVLVHVFMLVDLLLLLSLTIILYALSAALPAPVVDITPTGDSVAGSMYTLTCTVTVVENLVAEPTVEWLDSKQYTVTSGSDITVGSVMSSGSSMSTLTLEFNPLHTSHGGQYTCRATHKHNRC